MKQPVGKLECLACGHTDYRMTNRPVGDLLPERCPKCRGDMTVSSRGELPEELNSIGELVEGNFKIWDFFLSPDQMEFLVETEDEKESFSNILKELKKKGYVAKLRRSNGELNISVREAPDEEESNIWINIVLFLATIGTTFGVAGYWYLYDGNILNAALFSSAILTILGAHELGHKISTWKNQIEATWPYFLPVPHPLIGTFGAVIKNKSPIPSREALVELGSSGPISGFVFAVPITIVGLFFSETAGGSYFQMIPTPLIFSIIGTAIFGHFPSGLNPHPLAWAGFISLFVTWLNLLPTGQLDGGHVARSLMSENRHFLLTRAIGFSLLLLSLLWGGFLILALLIIFVVGGPHPGALNNISDLAKEQKILAVLTFTVFILCLPIPMWVI